MWSDHSHIKCGLFRLLRLSTVALLMAFFMLPLHAQSSTGGDEVEQLKKLVFDLQARVSALEQQNAALQSRHDASGQSAAEAAAALVNATTELKRAETPQLARNESIEAATAQAPSTSAVAPASGPSVLPANLPGGATLNYYFDGYFENNFNNPIGRVNNLRAYDVLSRVFSISQADVIFALDPDPKAERRYGLRLDLQFGQATETLQGNPANEPRPDIYRNIFQAYGTYVVPVGHGLNVDFGKWASSLGAEGNFAKDQINYTRSFWSYFLPFYHTGVRTSYHVNDKLALNYWIVNGANQSEPTNGFKDQLFGFVLQPIKSVLWTTNYYLGQEHPDSVAANNCNLPVQPGLCLAPITPAPNGKLHIFDTYSTWQVNPKLTLQGEADYVIQREWANAAPGQSSAPSRTDGGAGYVQYLISPQMYVAARGEYLSDRGGMFSNTTQALKEVTGTYRRNIGDGLSAFLEYRRDWSNQPYFVTDTPGIYSTHQDTAGIGLVWWYGGKQGTW
jgi:hypothetical protein